MEAGFGSSIRVSEYQRSHSKERGSFMIRNVNSTRGLVTGSVLVIGGLCAGTTLAAVQEEHAGTQVPASEQSTAATLDTVRVTGSRVMSGAYESPTPVTMIELEQIEMAAPNNIADYLNTLPSMVGDRTTTQGNNAISAGSTGMNRLNLRGLGSDRTLVLVDGRRFVGSTLEGNVDANGLPNGLIRSVDVVTGGASSVYGSDAVAGVVNFMLDTRYTGIKGFAQVGQSGQQDDEQTNVGLTFGTPFAGGRGHFLFNAEYAKNEGVGAVRDRDWFRGWGTMNNPAWTATNGEPNLITVPFLNRPNEAVGGLITSGPLQWTTFDPDGSPRRFDYGTLDRTGTSSSGGELDGHFASMSLKGAVERHNTFARGSFEVSDNFEVFAEASHARSVVNTNSSYNYYGGTLTIRSDNPYLDPVTRDAMAAAGVTSAAYGLLLGDASPRVEVNTYRAVFGVNGTFGRDWELDAYYQYGESQLDTQVMNTTNSTRLGLALDAVVDPGNGQIVCRSSLAAPTNGCVPINTFGGASMSDEALAYVQGNPYLRQTMKQQVLSASVRGEAFQMPAGAVITAFGVEHRRESVVGSSDEAGQAREWLFGNFLPTRGENKVNEAFSEILMPLVEDKLTFNGAARVADYSYSGTELTWKAGLTWKPVDSVLIRGVRSRDIRAPNLSDLYQAGVTQRQNVNDPWFGNIRRNIERVSEGNLDLTPEIADTYSLGVVYTPTADFQAAVDYYQIDIRDAISTLTNQQTVDRCYDGDQTLCQYVSRDATGALNGLVLKPVNIAKRVVRGVDFDMAYHQPMRVFSEDGGIDLRLVATRLIESRTENPFTSYDYAGENTGSSVKWRALGSATYKQGPLRLGASVRFVGSGVQRNDWVEGVDIDDNSVPSTWYLGLSGSYRFADDKLEAFFRVDNALDKDPVVISTNNNGLNATLYDVLGRYMSVGLRFEF
jgi:outer membrane receptor protein involved in Fe transport